MFIHRIEPYICLWFHCSLSRAKFPHATGEFSSGEFSPGEFSPNLFCIFLAYILFLESIWHMKYAKKNWHIFGIYFNLMQNSENSFRKPKILVKLYQIPLIFNFFSPNKKSYSSQKLCSKWKNAKKVTFA